MIRNGYSVRVAEPKDVPRLAEMFERYRAFYRAPARREAAVAFLTKRLASGDSHLIVAVDADDTVVAFAQLYPSFSSLRLTRSWLLADLFVAEEHRCNGLATALLDRARSLAVATNASSVELFTAHANLTARRLYESAGYTLDESFAHYEMQLPAAVVEESP